MKIKSTLVFILTLLSISLTAKTEIIEAELSLHQANYILNQLCESIELPPNERPILTINSYVPIAEYSKREGGTILINKAVLQLFNNARVNPDHALAIIIGHELAHHLVENEGGYANNRSSRKAIEKEADIIGIFIAHLAGYEVIPTIPVVFERIYTHFNLAKDHQSYPHYNERIQSQEEVLKLATDLIEVFDAANYLAVIGEHRIAAASYTYLLRHYKGKEIYNNIAVNFALTALTIKGVKVDLFLHPIELDFQTRLKENNNPMARDALSREEELEFEKWLTFAKETLLKIIDKDPNYLLDDINLISVYNLLGLVSKNSYYYNKAITHYESRRFDRINPNSKEIINLQLGYAISCWKSNTRTGSAQALKIWQNLQSHADATIRFQAKHNLYLAQNEKLHSPSFTKSVTTNDLSLFINELSSPTINPHPFQEDVQLDHSFSIDFDSNNTRSWTYKYAEQGRPIFGFQRIPIYGNQTALPQNNPTCQLGSSNTGNFLICKKQGYGVLLNDYHQIQEIIRFRRF